MFAVIEILLLIAAAVSGLLAYRFLYRNRRFNSFVEDLTKPETTADDVRVAKQRARGKAAELKKDARHKRVRIKDILKALNEDEEV